jgi:hypothetical protein
MIRHGLDEIKQTKKSQGPSLSFPYGSDPGTLVEQDRTSGGPGVLGLIKKHMARCWYLDFRNHLYLSRLTLIISLNDLEAL